MVIKRLDPENDFGFGFSDVQTKLVYDLSAKHQVQLAFTAGRSRLEQQPDSVGIGRNNVRAASPGINGNTFQVFGIFDSMFPMIPSAGFLLEF